MENTTLLNLASEYVAKETHASFRDEVKDLVQAENFFELNERFYTSLKFGTGGLRGMIGGGYNRMNPYTVRLASQGLADYILKNSSDPRIIIAYDSRRYSKVFGEEAARVFAGNGIKVFLFPSLRPTPELSFGIRHKRTTAGIVITASHNPPEYNGYKVYWKDGAQITPPHDTGIIRSVGAVREIRDLSLEEAEKQGLFEWTDETVDEAYLAVVKKQILREEPVREHLSQMASDPEKGLSVVYTPLHGAGCIPFETALWNLGVSVFTVPEQREPNGDFPTVSYPNPETAEAFALGLKYAAEREADLIMATDPDSDRLGVAVPDPASPDGYRLLNGNELGAVFLEYICSSRREKGTMPPRPAFVNTIVTTRLQHKIARAYGVAVFEVLTGFKYIGEKMREFEESGEYQYLFGCEESYGFLIEPEVRDKDAVSAAQLMTEIALYVRGQNDTLLGYLERIYEKYGLYKELLITREFKGQKGLLLMNDFMQNLRKSPPQKFAGIPVVETADYKEGIRRGTGASLKKKNVKIDLPSSDVLQFLLEDESLITVRPSGTEPKIKFYVSSTEPGNPKEAGPRLKRKLQEFEDAVEALIPNS